MLAAACLAIGSPAAGTASRISADDAIAAAVNDLRAVPGGVALSSPNHRARFTAAGVRLEPRGGGPAWTWRLEGPAVRPQLEAGAVVYGRGEILERYVPKKNSLEQEFVLPARPSGPLVLDGRIETRGTFRPTAQGWSWSNRAGSVTLGRVTVLDAKGQKLPARMTVRRDRTRIVVGAGALAHAEYPVTVDPEIGANDFRISNTGNNHGSAQEPAVAYNATANEYLVVWAGVDDPGLTASGEREILGQRIDAATGADVGTNDFRISDMGPNGDDNYSAQRPSVAWNSLVNEYLVVWDGDDDTGTLVNDEYEIFGQRLTASGAATGTNDFRISDMGPDGDTLYAGVAPDVDYNSEGNEYFVVWSGSEIAHEFEIYGQFLSASGTQVGTNDLRLTTIGTDGDGGFTGAYTTAVAYNHPANEFMVVFDADEDPTFELEYEIYRQRVDAVTRAETGSDDVRISHMGPDGDPDYWGRIPDVAYNPVSDEYLVCWEGDDNTAPLVSGEFEIFGQRLTATGTETGATDFRISDMGPNGNANYDAAAPAVDVNTQSGDYLVVWEGDDDTGALADDELELYGQRLTSAGAATGTNDFRISDMGTDGDKLAEAKQAAVAANTQSHEFLAVWRGEDRLTPFGLGDDEIFGQRLISAGSATGTNDFPISDMGDTDPFDAFDPAVAFNNVNNEYLVVWSADDRYDDKYEIFGQRINGTTGGEVGSNDFPIAFMGEGSDPNYDAINPAVAYDITDNQYLVVWEGDDDTAPLVNGENEIWSQRLDGVNGAKLGSQVRLSDMGPDGDAAYDANAPDVAFNQVSGNYLVVWSGDDNTGSLVDGEEEIYRQQVVGSTGAETGTNDFRASDMGPDGDANYDAFEPALAYNAVSGGYLLTWWGDDNTAPLVEGEYEVFGQRLTSAANQTGAGDFRISDMGPDGSTTFAAVNQAVTANSASGDYLVVWRGDDSTPGDNDFEIWGQRLDSSGNPVGTNDFRISDMGVDGSNGYEAEFPDVAYSATANQYLVVWDGDDNTAPLVNGEYEIFAQQLTAAGGETGPNDLRISDMGPNSDIGWLAETPAVAWDSLGNEFLAVWSGDDNGFLQVNNEQEIFGQRLTPGGATAVVVSSFGARRAGGSVVLRWRTGSESGIAGFEVWQGPAKLTRRPILARGGAYAFVARGVARVASFRLVAVGLDGSRRTVAVTGAL